MKVQPSGSPSASHESLPTVSPIAAIFLKRPSAATTPVSIAEVERRFGWKPKGWQDTLLRAADNAKSGNKDNHVTQKEIQAYLADPEDLAFLTSQLLSGLKRKTGNQRVAISSLKNWEKAAATAADENRNGSLSTDEFERFSSRTKAGKTLGSQWLPDQKASMFASSVASTTNEVDALLPQGFRGVVLDKAYMRTVQDEKKRTPPIVSYTLTAADLEQADSSLKRTDNFRADPAWSLSPSKEDYEGFKLDRGHMKPADDSPDLEAMSESFLMTNMAPQHGALNQATWRYLEAGIQQLVKATGGKATIHTGNLYLDTNGKPLADDAVRTIGKGNRKIAVPTHNFKTALLEFPDGKKQLIAFVVPNQFNLPRRPMDAQKTLFKSRVSVQELERLLGGVNLYPTLKASEAQSLKSTATPTITFPNANQYQFANLVWPQPRHSTR